MVVITDWDTEILQTVLKTRKYLLSMEKDFLEQLSEYPSFYDNIIEEFAKKDRIELHYNLDIVISKIIRISIQ
ncbi:hypothetical protein NQ317_016566 [Molorchus minor]|uniref:Uncharacterized protein n=1 Tax=Molorchus minor TaxID=1323400 RepID=A0ABQ9IQL2_9CUCU|nr:hypothetical protein NQ317_016566 [Molorchus minor]